MLVSATDLAGNTSSNYVASVTADAKVSFGFLAAKASVVNVLGKTFSSDRYNQIYLYFAIGVLAALAAAIAIRRKMVGIPVLAHASAMAVFAVLLWAH